MLTSIQVTYPVATSRIAYRPTTIPEKMDFGLNFDFFLPHPSDNIIASSIRYKYPNLAISGFQNHPATKETTRAILICQQKSKVATFSIAHSVHLMALPFQHCHYSIHTDRPIAQHSRRCCRPIQRRRRSRKVLLASTPSP